MDFYATIEGMHCGGCLNRIERAARQEGATRFEMNLAEHTARIQYDETNASPEDICAAIRTLGYRVSVATERAYAPIKHTRNTTARTKTTSSSTRRKRPLAWLVGGILTFATLILVLHQVSRAAFLTRHGLDGLDVVQIIDVLERRIDEAAGFQASVTTTKLVLSDQTGTFRFDIPKALFYLSIAPYVEQTHPCGNHSLVSCTGELQGVAFHFVLTDRATGEILYEGERISSAKGFVGFWVPSGVDVEIQVHSAFGSASANVSTDVSDGTCLTTVMLS